jgi:hypothetical protein
MRVVCVPGTLALLPEYASIEDPIPELRKAVDAAVEWLLEDGGATVLAASPAARKIADHLLEHRGRAASADGGGRAASADGGGRAASARDGGRAASASERSAETRSAETRPGLLVVANGSATRTEKAPGHLDERAAAFDAAIGQALSAGDPAALADIDLDLADELWALPDADVLRTLAERVPPAVEVHMDYDDDPFGVQYWVVRWQCP